MFFVYPQKYGLNSKLDANYLRIGRYENKETTTHVVTHLGVPKQVKITSVNARKYTCKINITDPAVILPYRCVIRLEESNRIKHKINIYFNSQVYIYCEFESSKERIGEEKS